MPLKKTISKAKINDTQIRYKTHLEDEPCEPDTRLARLHQHRLLQSVVENPDLMMCGPVPFQKLVMQHDGEKWCIDAEAVIEEGPSN